MTVETCAAAVTADEESPQFQGLSTADKASYGIQKCHAAQGQDLAPVCKLSCKRSCEGVMEMYAAKTQAETGNFDSYIIFIK